MHTDSAEWENRWIDLAQSGDMDAMQRLLEMHMPLIGMLSSRLQASYMDKETLLQAGRIGLMEAARHYQPEMNVKLITYAVPWILGEMKKALRREAIRGVSLEGMTESEDRRPVQMLCSREGIDITSVDLRMALEKLSKDLRLIVCLRYFRDKTQKETALLLGKSQAQISRMERQALDALYKHLA